MIYAPVRALVPSIKKTVESGEARLVSALAKKLRDEDALGVGRSVEPEPVHAAADVYHFSLELHHWAGEPGLEFHADGLPHFKVAVYMRREAIIAAIETVSDHHARHGGFRGQHPDGVIAVFAKRTASLKGRCSGFRHGTLHTTG
jgi:hypothetical protein